MDRPRRLACPAQVGYHPTTVAVGKVSGGSMAETVLDYRPVAEVEDPPALLTDGPRAELRMRAAHTLSAAVVEVVEGQCLDLSLEGSPALSQAAYLRLASAKTGALLGASLASGALLAGASTASVRRFEAAGRLLGLAFQIRDDWLGTWGDPER